MAVVMIALVLLLAYRCDQGFDDAQERERLLKQAFDSKIMGIASRSPQHIETAIAYYSEAIEVDPDNVGSYVGRGDAYHELDFILYLNLDYPTQKKSSRPLHKELYDKALEDYNKAKELDSKRMTNSDTSFARAMREWAEERQSATNSSTSSTSEFQSVSSNQASQHVGEIREVCGLVASTRYASTSKGAPTFLNFDYNYPNHTFAVMIWGSDRGKFPSNPERYYDNKTVCATGLVESYQGKPEIVATSANQLEIR